VFVIDRRETHSQTRGLRRSAAVARESFRRVVEGSFLVPELNGTVCPVRFRLRVLGRLDIISLDGCDDLNVRFLDGGELCQARSSDPERDDVHDEHAEECNDADSKLCEASVNVVGARSPPHRIGVVVPGVVDASAELLCVRELEVTRLQEMHEASREDDPTPKKPGGSRDARRSAISWNCSGTTHLANSKKAGWVRRRRDGTRLARTGKRVPTRDVTRTTKMAPMRRERLSVGLGPQSDIAGWGSGCIGEWKEKGDALERSEVEGRERGPER
jgi:hypothetical protein